MTNLDAARAMVENALAYRKKGDISTVLVNLELIQSLLKDPGATNSTYDWEDFK